MHRVILFMRGFNNNYNHIKYRKIWTANLNKYLLFALDHVGGRQLFATPPTTICLHCVCVCRERERERIRAWRGRCAGIIEYQFISNACAKWRGKPSGCKGLTPLPRRVTPATDCHCRLNLKLWIWLWQMGECMLHEQQQRGGGAEQEIVQYL